MSAVTVVGAGNRGMALSGRAARGVRRAAEEGLA